MCGFCNVWMCVCVGVWVFVCVGFVMCGCFGNMCACIYCVFILFRLCIFIFYAFVSFVSYVFLLLSLCILIVIYVPFCIFYFHRASWYSSTTLTEVFACFFLSCKANAKVQLAKTEHGPHSSQINCAVLYIVCV